MENQETTKPAGVMKTFLDSKFATPLITTIITAVVGPFVVVQVNSYIQNKSIQQAVIEKVLEHTNNQDLSKVQALEKIQIIASFVDENEEIFGLKFDSTLKSIRALKNSGYSSLSAELGKNLAEIDYLSGKISQDSANRVKAEKEIEALELEKARLEEMRKHDSKAKKDLDEKIAQRQKEIDARTEELEMIKSRNALNESELAKLKTNNQALTDNLKKAEADLANLLKEKNELNQQLDKNKKLLDTESSDKKSLQDALKKTNDQWQQALKDNEALQKELNNFKLENSKISKELASLQSASLKLKDQQVQQVLNVQLKPSSNP